MKSLTFIILCFFIAAGISTAGLQYFDISFENGNYWDYHGVWFLVFIAIFPRLTLLFSSVAFGGLLWWLGFFFAPRLLVAILATMAYWNQNWFLVVLAWLLALSGESSEKFVIHRSAGNRRRRRAREHDAGKHGDNDSKTIDAEYKVME